MPRIETPARADLSAEDQGLFDEIAGARDGTVAGPFSVWLLTPEVARGANALGNALRVEGGLDRDVFELITLVCARFWGSTYPWAVHSKAAREAGLSQAEIAVIEADEPGPLSTVARRLVYAVARSILRRHEVPQDLFSEAVGTFGVEGMIEITTIVGFYSTASIVAKVFDVDLPAG